MAIGNTRFHGPSRTLGSTASAPGISPHGDGLSVRLDVLEVLEGAGDLPAVDGLGGLAGVLERNTEVGTASAGGLGRLDFGGGVTDLWARESMVRRVLGLQEVIFSQSRRWQVMENPRGRGSCAQGELQHTILAGFLEC